MASSEPQHEEGRFQRTRDALAGNAPEGGAEASGSLSSAADRIRQMLVTAEEVSEDIRRGAQEEAERYLANARREADALVAARRQQLERALDVLRAEGREIERRVAVVTAAVEEALAGLPAGQSEAAPEPEPPAPEAAQPESEQPEPAAAEKAPAQAESSSGDAHTRQRALIRATQLAVQGVERAEVQVTLEREFGLDDAAAVVDEILGPE